MVMLDRVCRIVVYGDRSECVACGAKWDTNENLHNEPPNCAFDRMRQLSCDAQFMLAQRLAANVGYRLLPDDAPVDDDDVLARLNRIERDMRKAIEHRPWWWRLIGRTHLKRD